jgi:hypothetical protein
MIRVVASWRPLASDDARYAWVYSPNSPIGKRNADPLENYPPGCLLMLEYYTPIGRPGRSEVIFQLLDDSPEVTFAVDFVQLNERWYFTRPISSFPLVPMRHSLVPARAVWGEFGWPPS